MGTQALQASVSTAFSSSLKLPRVSLWSDSITITYNDFHTNIFNLYFVDVDECNASVPVCDVNANCRNTLGSYQCSCKARFSGNGKACTGEISDKRRDNSGITGV